MKACDKFPHVLPAVAIAYTVYKREEFMKFANWFRSVEVREAPSTCCAVRKETIAKRTCKQGEENIIWGGCEK